jgi:hypothetical protein
MTSTVRTTERAFQLFTALGAEPSFALSLLSSLENAGIRLADDQADELVVRWVNVLERAVPPDADTIIRTITRTTDGHSASTTHWLDGLRGPRA